MQTRTSLFALFLLLVSAFALRIPSFMPHFFNADESLYLIGGHRVAEGGELYVDAWENKPPILQWFYAAFDFLFGDGALTAIRVFTCLYLFAGALLFNQVIVGYRFSRENTFLPGFLFLFANAIPWYTQEMNAEQLMSLPMLGAFLLVLEYGASEHPRPMWLFWAGMLCGICLGIKFQAAFFFAAIFLGAAAVGKLRLPDYVTLAGGFGVAVIGLLFVMYMRGNLGAFYDVGLLYSFDYVRLGNNPGEANSWLNLLEILKVWGGFLLAAGFGFMVLRAQVATAAIRQRKFETMMLLWGVFGLAAVALGGRFYLHYFVFVLPPVLFYAFWYYHWKVPRKLKPIALLLMFAFPLFTYATFLAVLTPQNLSATRAWIPGVKPDGWMQGLYYRLHLTPQEEALRADLESRPALGGIWVATFQHELYLRLGQPCGIKYTNFSIAFYKMTWLDENLRLRGRLISDAETMADVYRAFQREEPGYIIDPEGVFGEIRKHLPLLLSHYRPSEVGGITVWRPGPKATISLR